MRERIKTLTQSTIVSNIGILAATIFAVIFSVYISLFIWFAEKNADELTQVKITQEISRLEQTIANQIETKLETTRTLAKTFAAIKNPENRLELSRTDVISMLRNILAQSNDVINLYTIWESNAFDGKDSLFINRPGYDKTGRFVPNVVKTISGDIITETSLDYNIDGLGDYYLLPRLTTKEVVMNPIIYTYGSQHALKISVINPIIASGSFLGIVGVDVSLNWLQRSVENLIINGLKAKVYILSHDGVILGNSGSTDLLGKKMEEIVQNEEEKLIRIKNGQAHKEIVDDDILYEIPIKIGETNFPWQITVLVESVNAQSVFQSHIWKIVFISLFLFIISLFVFISLTKKYTYQLVNLADTANQIAKGNLETDLINTTKDEIGQVGTAINSVIIFLREVVSIGSLIAIGDYTKTLNIKSEKDLLGKSINKMIDSLVKADEDDKHRKLEDDKLNWTTQGIAKFSDILRQNITSFDNFAYDIISKLVKYLDANQGGLFLYNDNEKNDIHLELVASFAYNRRKFLEKKIALNEGLVGTCALEKQTIFLTEIPTDYIEITSGIGKATPTSLLIVPLKLENEIFGIIEVASIEMFEPHMVKFVEKIGESIASTLSGVKINQRTTALLEESKKQADEKASQEEVMRQNMEELQATQEEAARREAEMTGQLSAINSTNGWVEYGLDGIIKSINDIFAALIGYKAEEMIGQHHSKFIDENTSQSDEYKALWQALENGISQSGVFVFITKNEQQIYLKGTYNPITNSDGEIEKIMQLVFDITENKVLEKNLTKRTKEMEAAQTEMKKKQNEVTIVNSKMVNTQKILEKALQKAKETEDKLKMQNEQMFAQEEEMRQNLEMLAIAQSEMTNNQIDLETINKEMQSNEKRLEKALEKAKSSEKELIAKAAKMTNQENELRLALEKKFIKEISDLKAQIEQQKNK